MQLLVRVNFMKDTQSITFAKHRNLKNLTIIIDINNLIILGNTSDCLKQSIKEKIEGLGINSVEVDGHNIDNLVLSLKECDESQQLNCILAKTTKGKEPIEEINKIGTIGIL